MSASTSLARRIHARAHLTGEFTLRSGRTSTEYFDKYLFEGDPELLRAVVEELVTLIPANTQVLAGLEIGGVPLATSRRARSSRSPARPGLGNPRCSTSSAAWTSLPQGGCEWGTTQLDELPPRRMVTYRRKVGFVFQRLHLLPALTAADNVAAPLLPYEAGKKLQQRARELLEQVGLGGQGRCTAFPAVRG